MRISTSTLFEIGRGRISDLQSSLMKTQGQLSANRRMLTAADDPIAAAQALNLTQSKEINLQYGVNRQTATGSLNMEEHVLQSVTSLLQDVQTLTVNAGNAALSDTERKFLATELNGRLEELVGLANTRDGAGNFLFSGYQSTSQPFTRTAAGASYAVGDQGQRELQVGPKRMIAVSDTGDAIFERIKTGNGVLTTAASNANTGSGVVSNASSINGASYSGTPYTIRFIDGTNYEVLNATTNVQLATGVYKSGESISVNNELQVEISGKPAANDSFSVSPSRNQSVFATLQNLVNVLNQPVSGDTAKAKLSNGLNTALNNVSNALDTVLTVRASVGARLNELESLDSQGESIDLQYAESLSQLQDLDYTKAITDLSMQKIVLEAAQQSFVKTSTLSLFNFI